jgi:hypothetical protein
MEDRQNGDQDNRAMSRTGQEGGVKSFGIWRTALWKLLICSFLTQHLLPHLLPLYPRLLLSLSPLRLELCVLPILLFLCGEPN